MDRPFFNKYTASPPYPWVSHLWVQTTMDQKQYFWFAVGNPRIQRANCMHCSTLFYTKDLSIRRFGWGMLEPSLRYQRTNLKFLESQNLYMVFGLHGGGVGTLNLCIVQGSCVYCSKSYVSVVSQSISLPCTMWMHRTKGDSCLRQDRARQLGFHHMTQNGVNCLFLEFYI